VPRTELHGRPGRRGTHPPVHERGQNAHDVVAPRQPKVERRVTGIEGVGTEDGVELRDHRRQLSTQPSGSRRQPELTLGAEEQLVVEGPA